MRKINYLIIIKFIFKSSVRATRFLTFWDPEFSARFARLCSASFVYIL